MPMRICIRLPGWCALALLLLVLLAGAGAVSAAPVAGPLRPVAEPPWYDPIEFPPTALTERLRACLPGRLHPVSRQFLDLWLAGRIGTRTFRRFFHMPNSRYLPVSACLVRVRTAMAAEARARSPI